MAALESFEAEKFSVGEKLGHFKCFQPIPDLVPAIKKIFKSDATWRSLKAKDRPWKYLVIEYLGRSILREGLKKIVEQIEKQFKGAVAYG